MIGTDYHIHTHYVGCADNTMTIPAILDRCRRTGRTSIAITDHCDKDWQFEKNRLIREELRRTDPGELEVFFGCEQNILNMDGEVAVTEEVKKREGFEIVVGGVHSTWFNDGEATIEHIIERQNDLMCKAAANPVIDVLVHPWWFGQGQFKAQLEGRFKSLGQVPDELTCRLAEVCVANDTAIELNMAAIFLYPLTSDAYKESYKAYIARFVELGCSISLSTDAHRITELDSIGLGERILDEIGLPKSRVWKPKTRARTTGQAVKKDRGR